MVWGHVEGPREDFSDFVVGIGGLMGGPNKCGVWWLAWHFAVDKGGAIDRMGKRLLERYAE